MARTRLSIGLTLGSLLLGCTGEPARDLGEPLGASDSRLSDGTDASACGDYPRNPDCDAVSFLQRAWELANENDFDNAFVPAAQAAACVAGVVAAGAATLSSDGIAAVGVTQVAQAIGVITACRGVMVYLAKTGLARNVSCFFAADVYDRNVALCQCSEQCTSGSANSGQLGDYSAPQTFAYGYLARAGSANCYCTNDAKEAECQWHCDDGFASDDPQDCTCLP
jgi:hypothetical protein